MLRDYCYPAIFYYEKNSINLHFPDIEEAYTFADNEKELWHCAREVLELSLESRLEDNENIPEPTSLDKIKLKNNQKIVLINVSVDEKIRYVKKTLTIPESLNIKAMKANINFSKVLANGIEKELDLLKK